MRRAVSLFLLTASLCSLLAICVQAVDYSYRTEAPSDYYPPTSYEDAYGSQYNHGGPNLVDYQVPELEYGTLSTTPPSPGFSRQWQMELGAAMGSAAAELM